MHNLEKVKQKKQGKEGLCEKKKLQGGVKKWCGLGIGPQIGLLIACDAATAPQRPVAEVLRGLAHPVLPFVCITRNAHCKGLGWLPARPGRPKPQGGAIAGTHAPQL